MNHITFLVAFLLLAGLVRLEAQSCTPAQNFPDTAIAIPQSWSPTRPLGGIQDTACIGQYFEFTLSLKAPAVLPILNLPVASIALPAQNGIANLPAGMSYVCNPPNCVFPKDTLGCVKLFGTPTNPAQVGMHSLTLSLTINLFPAGQFPNLAYPNDLLDPGGRYNLHVKPAGSSGCWAPSSTRDEASPISVMSSFPNPTTGLTQILLQSTRSGAFEFRVTDMSGKLMHRERVQIFEGENNIRFDGSALPAGMYLYSFSNGAGAAMTEKLVISRR